jgi:hypothetical protein
VTLYARSAGPGRPTILAVVDMFPSRVMVVLTGLYDCMTRIVIPDPGIMTGEKRQPWQEIILACEGDLEIAQVRLRT